MSDLVIVFEMDSIPIHSRNESTIETPITQTSLLPNPPTLILHPLPSPLPEPPTSQPPNQNQKQTQP
jgi:hypothetical protein